jgi:hypothetical protein
MGRRSGGVGWLAVSILLVALGPASVPARAEDCPIFDPPETWEPSTYGKLTSYLSLDLNKQSSLRDDFEQPEIDTAVWSLFNLGRFAEDKEIVRDGGASIRLSVDESDIVTCGVDEPCQRNELRVANEHRLPFAAESWYAFSFRVTGDFPRRDVPGKTARMVLGQWKQTNGESPYLAQRFDNGVFHITVQDGACRKTIAKAPGNTGEMPELLSSQCIADVKVEPPLGTNPLPDPYDSWVDMLYHVRGGLDGTGIIEVWANGQFIARATGKIGHAEGSEDYFKFGIYRRCTPGVVLAWFDNFRRGPTRESVTQP